MARKSHPVEFKQEAVRFVQEESMTSAQVAKDLGLDRSSVRAWCKAAQAGKRGGRSVARPPLTAEEELARLRREVRVLCEEREFPTIAAAFFAKETL